MNRRMICIAALAIGAGSWLMALGGAPTATDDYQPPDRLRVACVDMTQLFKGSTRFKSQMEEMKKKVDAAEEFVKKQQDRIKDVLPKDSDSAPVRSPVDENSAKLLELFNNGIEQQKKDFMREEGKIYFDILQEIEHQIEQCAKRHDIHVVFRISSEPVDPNDRNDILRGINKHICYVDHRLDITEEVLAALNASTP